LARQPPNLARGRPFSTLEFLGTGHAGSDYLYFIVRKGNETQAVKVLAGVLLPSASRWIGPSSSNPVAWRIASQDDKLHSLLAQRAGCAIPNNWDGISVPEVASLTPYQATRVLIDGIQRAGVIVGSHTKTHTLLPNETERRVRDEVAGSRQAIEER
jgi:hypothetical protein